MHITTLIFGTFHYYSDSQLTLEAAIEQHKADTLSTEKKHLQVSFLGEPAVDGGGPRREFLMLLMGTIANNGSILDCPPNRRVLRHNTAAFEVVLSFNLFINLGSLHVQCN